MSLLFSSYGHASSLKATNSTLLLGKLCLYVQKESPFLTAFTSSVSFQDIHLSFSHPHISSIIHLVGSITFSALSLYSSFIPLRAVSTTIVSFLPPDTSYNSTVSITNSHFKDLEIACTSATFTSTGYSSLQQVTNCKFENITALESSTVQDDWAVTEQSII